MKLKINSIIGILVGFLAVISSLFSVLVPSVLLRNMLVCLLIFLIVFNSIKKRSKRTAGYYIFLAVIMIAFLIVNSGWDIYDTLLYIAMLLLLLSSQDNINWTESVFKVAQFGYLFYAAATIFLYFNRGIYMDYVVPLFSNTANRLISWYNNGYMAGLTNHYSTNAMLLAAGIMIYGTKIIALGADKSQTNEKRRKRYIILFILLMASLLLTAKRAHILFTVSALFAVYWLSLGSQRSSNKLLKIVGAVLGVMIVANVILSLIPAFSGFIVRFQDTIENGDISMGRYQLWNYAIDTFKNHWLFGIGWKNFASKVSLSYNRIKMYDVHNIYLQLLAETGIIGASVYFFWFASFLLNTMRSYKQINLEGTFEDKYMLSLSMGFQIFFLLYGITGNPLYDNEMYIMYFISCAIALFYMKRVEANNAWR